MTAAVTPVSTPAAFTPERLMPWRTASRKYLPDWLSRLVFSAPLAPTPAEWQAVSDGVQQGDPLMDAVVDWMFEAGPRQAKPLFDRALQQGIASIDNPPAPLKAFFDHIEQPPAWLQPELLDKGALVSHLGGNVGFFVLRDMALMGGYVYFNSMNQTLAASGALGKQTSQRLGETGKWLNDVTEPGGMSRFGEGFTTTVRVRLVHALVRRNLQRKPDWNLQRWGVPINQIDMQATYLAFGPVSLLGARLFGVPVLPSQSAAFMHLWRYVGWLMGVDETRLAITERDGLRKLYHTFLTHRLPDEKVGLLGAALRDEPLERPMPDLDAGSLKAKWRRWFTYQQHLSNSSLILLPRHRRQLGLPLWILPWYPALSAPLRFVKLGWLQLRGGEALERYRQKARQQQRDLLQTYFGNAAPDIIQPGARHPAHL